MPIFEWHMARLVARMDIKHIHVMVRLDYVLNIRILSSIRYLAQFGRVNVIAKRKRNPHYNLL